MGPHPHPPSAPGQQLPPPKFGCKRRAGSGARPAGGRLGRTWQPGSPQWPLGWWTELGRGGGQGPARPPGIKAEQGEGEHSPGPGQPLAQCGEGGTAAKSRRSLRPLVLDLLLQGLAGGHWGHRVGPRPPPDFCSQGPSSIQLLWSAERVCVEGELGPLLLEANEALVLRVQVLGLISHECPQLGGGGSGPEQAE